MYGLILEGMADYIRTKYGEEMWTQIRAKAQVNSETFTTHQMYSEKMVPTLLQATQEVIKQPMDKLMEELGTYFVSFIGQYGYDTMLKVLGRHMRDFLNGLDNLHEYLKFSYPRLKAPSFRIENENEKGLTLHYRSKRKGFLSYVKGQIRRVAEVFYGLNVEIEVVHAEEMSKSAHVVMRLMFENTAFFKTKKEPGGRRRTMRNLPVKSDFFLECFPFHVIFDRNMMIRHAGHSITNVIPNLANQRMESTFNLSRPVMDFTFKNIFTYQNITFELVTIKEVGRKSSKSSGPSKKFSTMSRDMSRGLGQGFGAVDTQSQRRVVAAERWIKGIKFICFVGRWNIKPAKSLRSPYSIADGEDVSLRMRLKGQMCYIQGWDAIIFLASPVMENLDKMFDLGVYITDLSMHDVSRDLILVGAQQSRELAGLLTREQAKGKKLEDLMRKLGELRKRGDELLYSMIPSSVAAKLQAGESTADLCLAHQAVTVLFSDVPGFTEMTSKLKPMEVMSLLNTLFSRIDNLIERHKVYKVETIGDVYMVASGAPEPNPEHAIFMCNLAIDMIRYVADIKDPSTDGDHVKIRIGMHSGPVVTGVVGLKMPRFCFFGDTVNTASRMESNGESMKVHISEYTKAQLAGKTYTVKHRGTITVKGKGEMNTYWLEGKSTDGSVVSPSKVKLPTLTLPMQTGNVPTSPPSSPAPKAESPKPAPSPAEVEKPKEESAQKPQPSPPKMEKPKPKVEPPKPAQQQTEPPKAAQPPKAEAPKAAQPEKEAPKAAQPKKEAPKAAQPEKEAPKAAQPEKPKVQLNPPTPKSQEVKLPPINNPEAVQPTTAVTPAPVQEKLPPITQVAPAPEAAHVPQPPAAPKPEVTRPVPRSVQQPAVIPAPDLQVKATNGTPANGPAVQKKKKSRFCIIL